MLINIDDYNINYEVVGEGNADFCCLLIHGWGTDLYSLRLTANLLAKKFNVYSIDLPGFGKSDSLKKSFSIDDYVDIVVHFIQKMSIKSICLVGHSYGGRIIIKMNNRTNLLFEIKQNVFIDSAGIKQDPKKTFKTYIYKFMKNLYMCMPLPKEIKEQKQEELKNKFGSSDYRNAKGFLRDTLVKSVNEDLSNEIKYINKKSLLIWGEKDDTTPIKDAEFFKKNIKDSELYIIRNAGHFPFMDEPFEYEKIIKNYFGI